MFIGQYAIWLTPDPRFLASLAALSLVETLFTTLIYINNEFGQVRRTCRWDIVLPGGSSPRPPFSRFARRAVTRVQLHHCLDLNIHVRSLVSRSAPPTRARRAKRENGGLGEDPPGSKMSHLHPGRKPLLVSQLYPRQRAERSEKTGVWGRIPQEARCPTYIQVRSPS
jgi:hypothetical protein